MAFTSARTNSTTPKKGFLPLEVTAVADGANNSGNEERGVKEQDAQCACRSKSKTFTKF